MASSLRFPYDLDHLYLDSPADHVTAANSVAFSLWLIRLHLSSITRIYTNRQTRGYRSAEKQAAGRPLLLQNTSALPRCFGGRGDPPIAGTMNARVGLSFLILLIVCCIRCEGRSLGTSDGAVSETIPGVKTEYLEEYDKHKKFCILCEHFAKQATEYLKANKTQEEILETFHRACLRLPSFQQQCVLLVDYYAHSFFIEASSLQPHDLCKKINLCEDKVPPPSQPPAPSSPPSPPSLSMDSLKGEHICDFCQNAVYKVLSKLKDPGTELRIVERLVKGCVMAEHFAEQCQTLIFQYGPVLLVNIVRLLERADLCVSFHACQGNRNETVVPYTTSVALPLNYM